MVCFTIPPRFYQDAHPTLQVFSLANPGHLRKTVSGAATNRGACGGGVIGRRQGPRPKRFSPLLWYTGNRLPTLPRRTLPRHPKTPGQGERSWGRSGQAALRPRGQQLTSLPFRRPSPELTGRRKDVWSLPKAPEKERQLGATPGDAPTYRGGEAAPQGLELAHAKVLPQAASRVCGGLHAPAVRRSLRGDLTAVWPDLTAALPPFPANLQVQLRPPLPQPRRPPGAPGRPGDGSARAPIRLRWRT